MSTYFVDTAFSYSAGYNMYNPQLATVPIASSHESYYYELTSPAYNPPAEGFDCSLYGQGFYDSYYVHAPAPAFPIYDTVLEPPIVLDTDPRGTVTGCPIFEANLPPSAATRQPYSLPLPENGIACSAFTSPNPSESLATHAKDASTFAESSEDPRPATQRNKSTLKASEVRRRRAAKRRAKVLDLSSRLPFRATDPDTLTTHEKKRLYVGSLEEYAVWLEEQCRLAGQTPKPMQRIEEYHGITSRSLRTMLARLQDDANDLYRELRKEEEKFVHLEAEVLQNELADN